MTLTLRGMFLAKPGERDCLIHASGLALAHVHFFAD